MGKQDKLRELDAYRNFTFDWVRPVDLRIDTRYHSPDRLQEKRVERIANAWDINGVGVITVSDRGEAGLFLIDGNHRSSAAKRIGVEYLYAKVFHSLTLQEEATIFRVLSAAVGLTNYHLWLNRRVERDPVVLAVEQIAVSEGLSVTLRHVTSATAISCIGAMEAIFTWSPQLLRQTLQIAHWAWPEDDLAMSSTIIRGLSSFIACYTSKLDGIPQADPKRLKERLQLIRPAEIIRASRQARVDRSRYGSATGAVGRGGSRQASILSYRYERLALLGIYNYRLSRPVRDLTLSELSRLGVAHRGLVNERDEI